MHSFLQDLRHTLRLLLKTPGFTALALIVLALGIGANTAMFTVVNALSLRPLAGQADKMVGLFSHDRTRPDSYRGFSYASYTDVRDRSDVFGGLMAHTFAMVGVPAGETTARTFVELVSSNYFTTLGVTLAAGRPFTAEEERPGANIAVVIVAYDQWKNEGFDPRFLGRTLRVNAREFTIVGVTPRGFTGTMALVAPKMYFPLGTFDVLVNDLFKGKGTGLADRANDALVVAGRLKPGVTLASATGRLDALSLQLEEAFPADNRHQVLTVNPLPRLSTSTQPESDAGVIAMDALLMAMSAVVLLIACLNLANMLLARGTARRKEIAIRLALGATRWQIVRQLLIEGITLAVIGSAAGLVLAFWATRALAGSLGSILPIALEFDGRPDIRILAATTALVGVSTLVFGLGPALKLSRLELVDNLRVAAGESGDRSAGRWFGTRNLLVVGQLALSLLLLTCGGLFARGALKAAATDPGFSLDRELLVALDPSLAGYDEARGRATYGTVLDRLRGLPGIEAVGYASTVPFGDTHEGQPVERLGATSPPDLRGPTYMIVGADYFKALGLRLLRGREFTRDEEQSAASPRVAIIDEPLARQLFANEDPIGRQIRIVPRPDSGASGRDTQPMEIVGVAPGLRFRLFDRSPVPHLYVSSGRHYRANMNLHVRVAGGETASMLATIRRELKSADDRLPLLQLTTMSQFRDRSIELWAVQAGGRVFLTFGALALLLAVVGVYGVKSYVVSRRTREIGIRMALGARPADVLWLVLREGLSLTGAGLAIGLLLAAASGRLMASLLYQVSPIDPVVFTISPLLLAASATIACYVPARRATRVHPITALRAD